MDKNLLQKAKAPMIALIQTKNILKTNNLKTKTKRTFALLLMLGLLAPFAAWAQTYPKFYEFDSDSNGSINKNEMCIFFQDSTFCNFIFDAVDADKNGSLSLEEVKSFSDKGMDCNNRGITSLAGIELFEELPTIKCSNNSLTEIDLSYNIFVSQLECYGNQISGDKMDALITSLPQATDGIFIVTDLQNTNEQNICTTTQVAAALTRGWVVYAINGEETVLYEGEEVFGGGSGTETNPYIIATTDDMDALASQVNGGNNYSGIYFLMTDDLDYSEKDYTPIGGDNKPFCGTFDGNGHTISNINIDAGYGGMFQGVFGSVYGGTVKSLTLDQSSIAGDSFIGGIAGGITNAIIDNCHNKSTVSVTEDGTYRWFIGGIAGQASGNCIISNCQNSGDILGVEEYGGGIVGQTDHNVTISNCQNSGKILGKNTIGGIVGDSYNTTINNCSNSDVIQVRGDYSGGIVGWARNSTISNCQCSGTIYGFNSVGGIVGKAEHNTIIENCVTTMVVIAYFDNGGGIVAWTEDSTISNCLNLGDLGAHSDKGYIAGMNINSTFTNNYYYYGFGGINGSDVEGQAQRGYAIEPQHPLGISLEGSIGVFYDGKVYAGENQEAIVGFEVTGSSIVPQCLTLSAGTYTDTDDDTYTITMPAEDITVSGNIVEQYGMFYEIPCNGDTTATVIYDISYDTLDYAGIEDFEYGGIQYTVTAIADGAFDGLDNLMGIYCHSNISTIGDYAFRNCTGIDYFGFYRTHTPPTLGEGVFEGLRIDTLSITVPFCSQYDYDQHAVFGQFGEIFGNEACEYNFYNVADDNQWSNPANWRNADYETCTEAPGADARVAIFADCEIGADVTVGSITIDGFYDEYFGLYNCLTVKNGATLTATSFIYNSGDARNFIIEDGAQVIHPNAGAQATVEKNITAYTPNSKNGWHLVSSPAIESFAPSADNGFLINEYDLYYYHEPTHYWRNHKDGTNNADPGFGIEPLKGYLYANSANDTLSLKGTLRMATETVNVPLSYTDGIDLAGFNLVGNPFAHNVTSFTGSNVATEVYRMNGDGNDLMVGTIGTANPLLPGEGFFVKATGDDASITFNSRATNSERSLSLSKGRINVELSENGLIVDRFILKREGEPMEKFTLRENGTKIYATQDGQDYAVVSVGGDITGNVSTEMPVNFKAAKDGIYTLTVNVENMELDYLHLIDNLTGADVDLLTPLPATLIAGEASFRESGTLIAGEDPQSTPSYTFTAQTTDYASRFRLVFSNSEAGEAACEPDAPFAFVSNGNIIVNGEGILQVIDMTGRVIISAGGHTRCVTTSGMPAGVYVLRLIDGEDVRTQKIVIE